MRGMLLAVAALSVGGGLGFLHLRAEMLDAAEVGWVQVCRGAPHQKLTPRILTGLREAKIQVGLKGWAPDVAWINEQCAALGYHE